MMYFTTNSTQTIPAADLSTPPEPKNGMSPSNHEPRIEKGGEKPRRNPVKRQILVGAGLAL